MNTTIAGAILALAVTAASAAEDQSSPNYDINSANYRVPYCRESLVPSATLDSHTIGEAAFCKGVVHGIAVAINGNTDQERCADVPPTSTSTQLVRVVLRYIEARPERMHERFNELAFEALMDAWPCKAPEPKPQAAVPGRLASMFCDWLLK